MIDRLTTPGAAPWLDSAEYTARLLLGAEPNWLEIDGIVAWLRQGQALLGSTVANVNLGAASRQWIARDPALRQEMGARSRPGYPLRTMLDAPGLRAHAALLVDAVGKSLGDVALACIVPSPRTWLVQSWKAAFPGEPTEIDDDLVDAGACYIADFIRELPEARVHAIVIDVSDDPAPPTTDELALFRPVFNVARHYRWTAGILAPRGAWRAEVPAGGSDFIISPERVGGCLQGLVVPEVFWTGDLVELALAPGCFRYARIPPDANPEQVLARIAAMR
ncbi:MAG: hypothetical protein AB7D33_04075 [Sphingobium sp.]